jgi:hypothetical protein
MLSSVTPRVSGGKPGLPGNVAKTRPQRTPGDPSFRGLGLGPDAFSPPAYSPPSFIHTCLAADVSSFRRRSLRKDLVPTHGWTELATLVPVPKDLPKLGLDRTATLGCPVLTASRSTPCRRFTMLLRIDARARLVRESSHVEHILETRMGHTPEHAFCDDFSPPTRTDVQPSPACAYRVVTCTIRNRRKLI